MKSESVIRWNSKDFLLFVILMQFSLDIAVLLDIPVARQVIGFLCLTFIPGFIIFKLLRFDKHGIVELLLFSAGFSIAFLFIMGLLANDFGLLLGVSGPLSQLPLMVILNCFLLTGGVLVYLRNRNLEIWSMRVEKSPFALFKKSPFVLFYLCLPILSIVGAIYMTAYGNNLLLLFSIISIAVLFIGTVFSKRLLPSELFPFALFIITITILFHSALISQYIVPYGSDVPGEYIVFKTVENHAYWNPTYFLDDWYGRMNSMLSITILPTCYAVILNLKSDLVFKILYPLIFSLVPLCLYKIWQKFIDKKYAFISAFLFVSFEPFFTEMLGLNRQIIAELFFVLLILVLMNREMKPFNKITSFIIFSFALITSHYALAIIFLFFIVSSWVSLIIWKRRNVKITTAMIILFLVIMFAWYIYISGSATFNSVAGVVNRLFRDLNDFLNLGSRGETVLVGLGISESPSIWHTISRVFAYISEALIVFGIVGLVTKRVKVYFEKEYFVFSLSAMALLAMVIAIPGLANSFNMTRFYQILLFFLAPLCIIGVMFVVSFLSRMRLIRIKKELAVTVLLLIILVPYFLFQTEFVFEVTKSDSYSLPLSGYRMSALRLYGHFGYTDALSAYGARWLSEKVDAQNLRIYAGVSEVANVLKTQGMIYTGTPLSNTTKISNNGVVYMGTLNTVSGVIIGGSFSGLAQFSWNVSEFLPILNDMNTIYANGGSIIYQHSH